jgi:hypothetical protein
MPRQLTRNALINGVEYEAGTPEAKLNASPGELASLVGAGHLVDPDDVTPEADDDTSEAQEQTPEPPAVTPAKPKRSRK